MSTPCFDAMDDPSDIDEPWRGTEHASSEWEHLEPLAGPEYRMWRNLHQGGVFFVPPVTLSLAAVSGKRAKIRRIVGVCPSRPPGLHAWNREGRCMDCDLTLDEIL